MRGKRLALRLRSDLYQRTMDRLRLPLGMYLYDRISLFTGRLSPRRLP